MSGSPSSPALLVLLGLLLGLAPPPTAHAQSAPDTALEHDATLERIGRVEHPPIDEMSGIVRSRWQENVWWVHNDSGDEPRLFAIDSTGTVHVAPWHAGDSRPCSAMERLSPSYCSSAKSGIASVYWPVSIPSSSIGSECLLKRYPLIISASERN